MRRGARAVFLFVFVPTFFSLFFLPCAVAAEMETRRYDVVVVGAGSGGCSAAIQAARMGVSVALAERSDWVGGQMTGAAVSTMDDKTMTRTGIYNEFITRVRDFYDRYGRNVNVCYWGNDTIAFEPWAGQRILLDMIRETEKIDLYLKATPLSVKKTGDKITSAVFKIDGKEVMLSAKVFIDATEHGDFIPLTGARYRSGNSLFPSGEKYESIIQDITYPAVIKKYPDGLPPRLRVTVPPPRYNEYIFYFRSIVRPDGDTWPGNYPFNVPTHNAYRAMPDPAGSALVLGGEAYTWPFITKTAINWANDYPGNDYPFYHEKTRALSIAFLENADYRREIEREAMLKTLCFIYYMQTELGMSDWSVDDRQGFGTWFSNDWQEWDVLDERYAPILSLFPPFPYVRESRRIVGITTMTIDDVKRDPALKRTLTSIPEAIALGEYPTDIHGKTDDHFLEADLGETKDKLPNDWQGDGGLFQIPLGVLIPEKIDGLLAAEKNISVSRVVNGSTRLQPVTMLTGQAAGAVAALAVQNGVEPRALRALEVQDALWRAKTSLSIYNFKDVPPYSVSWGGVQAAVNYGYMEPVLEDYFGAFEPMHWAEVRDMFRKVFGARGTPKKSAFEVVTLKAFSDWLNEVYADNPKTVREITVTLNDDKPLTKGKLADVILELQLAELKIEKRNTK